MRNTNLTADTWLGLFVKYAFYIAWHLFLIMSGAIVIYLLFFIFSGNND